MRNGVHELEDHELLREQPQGPPRAPLGRRAARQVNELRLRDSVELPCVRTRLPLAFDRRNQALHHACPSRSLDGGDADAELVDDLLVDRAGVREQ